MEDLDKKFTEIDKKKQQVKSEERIEGIGEGDQN